MVNANIEKCISREEGSFDYLESQKFITAMIDINGKVLNNRIVECIIENLGSNNSFQLKNTLILTNIVLERAKIQSFDSYINTVFLNLATKMLFSDLEDEIYKVSTFCMKTLLSKCSEKHNAAFKNFIEAWLRNDSLKLKLIGCALSSTLYTLNNNSYSKLHFNNTMPLIIDLTLKIGQNGDEKFEDFDKWTQEISTFFYCF